MQIFTFVRGNILNMERRLWYIVMVVFLITVNQFTHLRELYQIKKNQYVYQCNDVITAAIYEFNCKAMDLKHLLSYNASENVIIYDINRKITRIQLHEEDNVQRINMRACYDI